MTTPTLPAFRSVKAFGGRHDESLRAPDHDRPYGALIRGRKSPDSPVAVVNAADPASPACPVCNAPVLADSPSPSHTRHCK